MDRAAAKELLHIDGWLERSAIIVEHGKDAYLADDLLQEAGDPLTMNRNFIIHPYDQINRELTWLTLSVDLLAWQKSLTPLVEDARAALDADTR